jgi:hypothetical protein
VQHRHRSGAGTELSGAWSARHPAGVSKTLSRPLPRTDTVCFPKGARTRS